MRTLSDLERFYSILARLYRCLVYDWVFSIRLDES